MHIIQRGEPTLSCLCHRAHYPLRVTAQFPQKVDGLPYRKDLNGHLLVDELWQEAEIQVVAVMPQSLFVNSSELSLLNEKLALLCIFDFLSNYGSNAIHD